MKNICLLLIFVTSFFCTAAQTILIAPNAEGGFENGTSVAANGWATASAYNDKWVVGNAAGVSAGSNAAYISAGAGAWAYSQTNSIQHLYKIITVPSGEPLLTLIFKWKANGEGAAASDLDNLKVFVVPSNYTIMADMPLPLNYQISGTGATSGMYKLSSTSYNTETINFSLAPAGDYKIVFSWKSDLANIANPPSAIDEISVISKSPTNISSTAIGGLWSSPATWVGGVVPLYENAIIADGAIVTIDQTVNVNNLTIGSGASGILQWDATSNKVNALGNVQVNAGAKLNMFSALAAPNGTNIYVGGNFINNGTVHAGYVATNHAGIYFNNPNASPTLGGNGTFINGIISLLFFQTTGNCTINTTQNIVTRTFANMAGHVNTNGKLSIDNTSNIFGLPINKKIYEIVVTNMGSGYSTANPPTINIAAPASGITATAIPNIDDATGTLRSITILNDGDGYRVGNPAVTISGGAGIGASATAVVNLVCSGTSASVAYQSGMATLTGTVNIKSDQTVGSITTSYGGEGYTTAPIVGMPLPGGSTFNLITNIGAGYSALPTITVSGGTKISTATDPTFAVVVAQGKVVSVYCTSGAFPNQSVGIGWLTLPTLTITGGGGAGATCAFPIGCLATATASISNGAVNSFAITNAGFGYTSITPTPQVRLEGGGFTTAATNPVTRIGLYNLNLGLYPPANADITHSENNLIPTNRRINSLSINSKKGVIINGDIELYGFGNSSNNPINLVDGIVNMGANTLYTSHPLYAGVLGANNATVLGKIKLVSPGGSVTRNFPFDNAVTVTTGTGALTTGAILTSITASSFANPSGTVITGGFVTGARGIRLQTNAGTDYGTAPTVTLYYNQNDGIVSDNQNLFVTQAASNLGPWSIKSIAATAGILPSNGVRSTDVAMPITPTADDYYAWASKAADAISLSSGNWADATIWSSGQVPLCTDRVVVNSTHHLIVNTIGNKCKSVVIANNGDLLLQGMGILLVGGTCP